jgi:hypothetical protein
VQDQGADRCIVWGGLGFCLQGTFLDAFSRGSKAMLSHGGKTDSLEPFNGALIPFMRMESS